MSTIKQQIGIWLLAGCAILTNACSQTGKNFPSPPGYNLNHPQKIVMPEALHEISGITFYQDRTDTVYAEQDEEGKVFFLHPGDKTAAHFKFGKHGDYEDIAICGQQVIMLRSDGTLYTFPFSDLHQEDNTNVKEFKDILPKGEYEGLHADEATKQLYVLCKHCADEKTSKTGKGYILQLADDGTLSAKSSFEYDVQQAESMAGTKKAGFHPSALGFNPLTKEWYILSSVNKMLVVADGNWAIKAVYNLNPAIYIQPEGIAFDKQGNLYISNEGGDIHAGNILKITYSGK